MTWHLNNNHNNKLWKILKEMGIPDHLTCLLRNLYAGQEAKLELNIEKWIASKLGKEYDRAVHCHPAYLTYKWAHHAKCQAEWITIWNQDCQEKYQQLQICRYHFNGRNRRGAKEPLDEDEWGEWKSWLKTQYSKNKDHSIQSHHFMANRWG